MNSSTTLAAFATVYFSTRIFLTDPKITAACGGMRNSVDIKKGSTYTKRLGVTALYPTFSVMVPRCRLRAGHGLKFLCHYLDFT